MNTSKMSLQDSAEKECFQHSFRRSIAKLNQKQQLSVEKLDDFIKDNDSKEFYLLGYAGTGKTFLICHIIRNLLLQKKIMDVFICAPTHQALNVIESYFKSNLTPQEQTEFITKVNFITIHKLLGFKPIISNETGNKIFKSVKESKILKKARKKLVIIDECSMISSDMAFNLKNYAEQYSLKIIYLGDDAQLPPVDEKESSIFQQIPENYTYHIVLDEIMRTSSDEIKKIAHLVRTWDQKKALDKDIEEIYKNQKMKNFKLYHKKSDYLEATWFKNFTKKITSGQIPIILTWKNSTSDMYNQIIRKYIHQSNDIGNYQIGDLVMFKNFYVPPDKCTSFYTSDMAKILEIENKESSLIDWKKYLMPDAKNLIDRMYNLLIKKLSTFTVKFKIDIFEAEKLRSDFSQYGIGKKITIKTIRRDDLNEYQMMLSNIREHIEFFFKKYKSESYAFKLWDLYHKNLVDPYADLNFGYSTTTHKAQGSTFKSVLVDIDDIFENPNRQELKKMLYTATTRSSHELGFLLK